MRVLRWIGGLIGFLAIFAMAAYWGARLHDGPLGPIPGGALASGEWYALPVSDWSFAKDVAEVELQLASQRTSRTTWILVNEGAAYVPCSLSFPPGKTWYQEAQRDGRAVLRINGQRYAVTLARQDDPSLLEFAAAEVARKYRQVPSGEGGVMLFRVESRPTSDG